MRSFATRTLSFAKLAAKGRRQSEEASAALSYPSARLVAKGCPGVPTPTPESTFATNASTTQAPILSVSSCNQSDAPTKSSWRGCAANSGIVATSDSSTLANTHREPARCTNALILNATPGAASRQSVIDVSTRLDRSRPAVSFPCPPAPRTTHDDELAASPSPRPSTSLLSTSPAASVPSAIPATTSATLAPAQTEAKAANIPASGIASSPTTTTHVSYNELKDGSFSGRIVQHDGTHAVHLLVSGTGSRDYNLRMVRCHARDELRFSSPAATHASASISGAVYSTGVARGENVSFATFMYRQVRDAAAATFLPAGYPTTTGQNYVRFMAWQGLNNVTMTANSVLASTFMLYAVGLGAGSIPTAGALNWVLKDGMGQLGTLVFGKTIAHNFDVHSKTWFFLSAVMLQAAAALELLTVLVPEHFLLMGSLANTLKGLAWMAAGSTRSVFHLSFARDNNIADVTAKGTSQYIFASLMGTAGGAVMCAAVGQSGAAAATCFGALAAATLGSAYLGVQAIPLSTLNATRLQLLVDAFLTSISPSAVADQRNRHSRHSAYDNDEEDDDTGGGYSSAVTTSAGSRTCGVEGDDRDILSGVDGTHAFGANGGNGGRAVLGRGLDAVGTGLDNGHPNGRCWDGAGQHGMGGTRQRWPRARGYRTVDRCYIGPSTHEYEMMYDDSLDPQVPTPLELTPMDPPLPYFSRTADHLSPPIIVGSHLEHIVEGNANLLVMLLTTYKYAHFMVVPRHGALHVVLHDRADPRDMVQAYLQACILRRRLRGMKAQPLPDADEQTAELRLELQESLAAAERLTTIFMSTIEANGWTVSKVVVEARRRRARW